jgi:uncharacterized protein YndB with AHSA1/START domain
MAFDMRSEDLGFVDRAPVVISEQVVVEASASAIWPALADAEAWTDWFGCKAARYTSPEPIGVGSTRFVHVEQYKVNEEILAYDENERFAFRVCDANLPLLSALVEVITLDESDGTTTVTYIQALEPKLWMKPLTGVFAKRMRKGLAEGLSRLDPWLADNT